MKTLSCKDVGIQGCDWSVTGSTNDEVIQKAAEHARTEHGMTQLPEDMQQKILGSIRDVKAA